jgi:hypothetical protein
MNNEFDLLSPCLPSPESESNSYTSYNEKKPTKAKSHRQQEAVQQQQPTLKRGTRNSKNHRIGSAAKSNGNNVKKGTRTHMCIAFLSLSLD